MNSYKERLNSLEKTIEGLKDRIEFLKRKSSRLSNLRLIIFIAGTCATVIAFTYGKTAGIASALISIFVFLIIVNLHNRLLHGMRRHYEYLKIKQQHLARMRLDWENIPAPAFNQFPDEISTQRDLDISGKYSLHNLIDMSISFEGSHKLLKWFSEFSPLNVKEIFRRQAIIKELREIPSFRDKFILKSVMISKKFLDCRKILSWTGQPEKIEFPKRLIVISSVLIFIYSILFILSYVDFMRPVWPLFVLIYFILYSSNWKKISAVTEESVFLELQLKKFTSLVNYIFSFNFQNYPSLKEFLKPFANDKSNAALVMGELQKIVTALSIRENPILRLLLNALFPYDFYFCRKLTKIKSDITRDIPVWIETLNELECLISISNFSYLNPDYIFPDIDTNKKNVFDVSNAGHPLIKREVKVCNNFAFDKEDEIVIITGSNMSGKSTFLKTLGINLCLAYSGAPVNAGCFGISLYEVFTCIKVSDSVIDGISYFYAEVKRLKELLDEFENKNGLQKFFLIDEIFKGTNNKERLEGSRAYIKKLSELKGTGFISTHDLELVNLGNEISQIENYHFREEIAGGKMSFDYKIHPGPCPTTNALKIMEISGLPVK